MIRVVDMHAFWILLLVILVAMPLLLPFRRGSSWRDANRKSAVQVVAEIAPPKYRLVLAFLYFGLLVFATGKVRAWF